MKSKTCIKIRFWFNVSLLLKFSYFVLMSYNLSHDFSEQLLVYAAFYCLLLNIHLYTWFYLFPLWTPLCLPLLQFNDLQECYLQKRRHAADKPHSQQDRDVNLISREGYSAGLDDFQSVLTTFTRYRYLLVLFCHLKYEVRHWKERRVKGYFPGRIKGSQSSLEKLELLVS